MAEIFPKCDGKKLQEKCKQLTNDVKRLGRFKAEAIGYSLDIELQRQTAQVTKFIAERYSADIEEGDENEKRLICSFNSSEAHVSKSQRRPLGNVPGGVLPYMGYIGMCGHKGYGFSAVLVINRVSIIAILPPLWS